MARVQSRQWIPGGSHEPGYYVYETEKVAIRTDADNCGGIKWSSMLGARETDERICWGWWNYDRWHGCTAWD
jgi:hypothetical protein